MIVWCHHAHQRVEVASIGQLVEVDDLVVRVAEQVPDQGRANKTGAAGDDELHNYAVL